MLGVAATGGVGVVGSASVVVVLSMVAARSFSLVVVAAATAPSWL